jgi:hypothetical protein
LGCEEINVGGYGIHSAPDETITVIIGVGFEMQLEKVSGAGSRGNVLGYRDVFFVVL